MFDVIRAVPGVSTADVARALQRSYNTVRWHVDVLRRLGRIVRDDSAAHRLFPNDGSVPRALRRIWVIEHGLGSRARVLEVARRGGPVTLTDLCARLGITKSTASKAVASLASEGVIVRETVGRAVVVRLAGSPIAPTDGRRADDDT